LNISLTSAGVIWVVWLILAIPTVVYLAGRKTDTRQLTIFWGIVAALFPPFGLLFILALLIKDDRARA
jgi:predicted membrane-bound dolichyl-phosphate-mannose-protein mannosyltransferase